MVRLHACFLVLLLVGCGQSTAPAEVEKKPARPNIAIEVTPAPVPARYAAPLPHTLAGLEAWSKGDPALAPRLHVIDSILLGDPEWLQRFDAAATQVSKSEAAAFALRWNSLFGLQPGNAEFCTGVRAIVAGAPGNTRAALIAPFVMGCATAADAPLVLRADTPSVVVVKYYDPWSGMIGGKKALKYHPRLAQAVREVIEEDSEHHYETRNAAFTLSRLQDPAADAALLDIRASLGNSARADEIGFAFANSKNPAGQALFRATCERRPKDPICAQETRNWLDAAEAAAGDADQKVSREEAKARLDALRAMGFEKIARLDPAGVADIDAQSLLLEAGQAYWFDVETGTVPNLHDSLLRHLARLPEPSLRDVVFEEVAPDVDSESDPYRLIAYANGRRYATEALNLGDWYDVDALLMPCANASRKPPAIDAGAADLSRRALLCSHSRKGEAPWANSNAD
jgi:hypothetical protein